MSLVVRGMEPKDTYTLYENSRTCEYSIWGSWNTVKTVISLGGQGRLEDM